MKNPENKARIEPEDEIIRLRETLRQERFFLDTLMNYLPDFIYFKDRQSRFIRINRSHAVFFDLKDPEEAIGKTDFDFFSEEHARQAFKDEQRIMETGEELHTEEKETHHNAPDTWASTVKMPLRDNDGNIIGTFGMSRDITHRKKTDEEIKRKNQQLQESIAEKDKFFSILAHDLRDPLSTFVATTELITEDIRIMPFEEIVNITQSMKDSATAIYRLLENLLEWSKLKRDTLDSSPEKILLKESITNSIYSINESANAKNINIEFSDPGDLTGYINKNILGTVLRNILNNSVKFTHRGGKINISAEAVNNDHCKIIITDSGIGMSDELVNKLFLINKKTKREGTEGEHSGGLGLLLSKELLEKNNGKIEVKSREGEGSSFIISIPGHSPA